MGITWVSQMDYYGYQMCIANELYGYQMGITHTNYSSPGITWVLELSVV
jgi:hypothetical protein